MKPSRYHALKRAVEEELSPSEEEWDEIDQRVEELRTRN